MHERDTRTRILRAAEEVISKHGVAAATLREITSKAGVNLGAVNYHFGSKDQLLEKIMLGRLSPVYENRLERLSEIQVNASREGRMASLDEVIDAFLEPVLERIRDNTGEGDIDTRISNYLFYERGIQSSPEVLSAVRDSLELFIDAIVESEQGLDRKRVASYLFFVSQLLVFTIMDPQMASRFLGDEGDSAHELNWLRIQGEFRSFVLSAFKDQVKDPVAS